MPATRPGVAIEPAISVMLRPDVLDAMTAAGGRSCSICCEAAASLRSIFSGAASMTRSASCTASGRLVVAERRFSEPSASPGEVLPSSTPFRTICSMAARPLATAMSETSYIRVS